MAVTAAQVKELRERTGAGMMECKKALVATDGDLDGAIEQLRKSGLAKADKKASRVAAEGVIASARDGAIVAVVEVNCETDFVAKDRGFLAFAQTVADQLVAADVADVPALLDRPLDDGATIEHTRQELVTKVGENVQVRRFERRKSPSGVIGTYLHGGRIGVITELEGGDEALARDLAMHVAAMRPDFVSADDVPVERVEKEREILVAQARDSGKPDVIIEKMVEGRLRKFLEEITLLGQQFVKDSDITVAKLLEQAGAKVRFFTRLEVGEGIEKKVDNFAQEVMAQAGT